jgi:hypothetical protein
MGEPREYTTREELPPQLRAISDTLDEWLSRKHGIVSSWQGPDWFLAWLEERGWTVVEKMAVATMDQVDASLAALEPKLDGIAANTDALISQRDALLAQVEALEKRLEHEATRLRQAICECCSRGKDDIPLDNDPKHHDFTCPYRTGAPGGLLDAARAEEDERGTP